VAAELNMGDEEVDISDPNQGKKLRVGRKMKKLPKDGLTRSFDDLHLAKEKKKKEQAKLDARRAKKGKKGIKRKPKTSSGAKSGAQSRAKTGQKPRK
jgi:hypothetical protein